MKNKFEIIDNTNISFDEIKAILGKSRNHYICDIYNTDKGKYGRRISANNRRQLSRKLGKKNE